MRGAIGGIVTAPFSQQPQARFSRLIDPHEVPRRFDVQLLAFVVTDDRRFRAALQARLLRAADDFLDARQSLRQTPPARMQTPLAARSFRQRSTSRFRLDLVQRSARLFVGQQLQLQIGQRLAARSKQLHALLPQLFGECLDF